MVDKNLSTEIIGKDCKIKECDVIIFDLCNQERKCTIEIQEFFKTVQKFLDGFDQRIQTSILDNLCSKLKEVR